MREVRVPWEQIEPVAELFPDSDGVIDSRADDFPEAEADPDFTGFHALEYGLFAGGDVDMAALADRLDTDIQSLIGEVEVLEIQPQVMTNGAAALIEEAAQTKITGEEERYSGTDLVTLQANVDGANKVFVLVSPLLASVDKQLDDDLDGAVREGAGLSSTLPHGRRVRALQRGERSRPSQAQDVDGRAERAAEPGLGLARLPSERVADCPRRRVLAASPSRWRGRGHRGRRRRSVASRRVATTPTADADGDSPARRGPGSRSKVATKRESPHRRSATRSSPHSTPLRPIAPSSSTCSVRDHRDPGSHVRRGAPKRAASSCHRSTT